MKQHGIIPGSIEKFNIYTQEESHRIAKTVLTLKKHWISRHPKYPVFSFGAVNYYDIPGYTQLPYVENVKKSNPVLWKHFEWMYKKLIIKLEEILTEPVGFDKQLALPGFHIFEFHDVFRSPEAVSHHEFFRRRDDPDAYPGVPVHVDTPYLVIGWGHDVDLKNPISFTLGIQLPKTGSGLKVWNLRLSDTINKSENEIWEKIENSTHKIYKYDPGTLVLHDGKNYHQAWCGENINPGEMRLTLQGHGVFCRGKWILYW